jgi:protein-S-isoprenylcysteine O-methyltransferase Ste14
MDTNNNILHSQEQIKSPRRPNLNSLKVLTLVIATILIGFGAILLEDGLTDAKNRHPGVKRHIDKKEIAIVGAFMLGGVAVVALSFAALQPRYPLKTTFVRASISLGCGIILAFGMRGIGIRFDKPHWFTTNVPVKVPIGGGRYWDTKIRARALAESLSNVLQQNE